MGHYNDQIKYSFKNLGPKMCFSRKNETLQKYWRFVRATLNSGLHCGLWLKSTPKKTGFLLSINRAKRHQVILKLKKS